MSTTMGGPSTRTYRGRSLEEIVPRIREELGNDAVIVRRRDGLTGGIGGFFQKRCVEVEARSATPRVDLYDEDPGAGDLLGGSGEETVERPALLLDDAGSFVPLEIADLEASVPELRDDAASREGLATPAMRTLIDQAQPFAEALNRAARAQAAGSEAERERAEPVRASHDFDDIPEPAPAARERRAPEAGAPALVAGNRRPAEAAAIERELVERGLHADLARMVVSECVSHLMPVSAPDSLRTVVRRALARRIQTAPGWSGHGRALALVGVAGSGKTACAGRLARAYAAHSDVPVLCLSLSPRDGGASLAAELGDSSVPLAAVDGGAALRERVHAARSHAAVIVDTPSAQVVDPARVRALAEEIADAGLYEVHLVLPATLSAPAAREQLRALAPLGATRVVLTRLGETDHPGPVLGVLIEQRLALSYVSAAPGLIEPAEPDELARGLLP